MPTVAINGLGRIGRAALKILLDSDGLELAAVNDIAAADNLAYLLNVRSANAKTRAEAIADFVQAERIRTEVLSICESLVGQEQLPDTDKYWVLATMAEAYLGTGNEELAAQKLQEAKALSTLDWMIESTDDQMTRLRSLLAKSPLQYVREEG